MANQMSSFIYAKPDVSTEKLSITVNSNIGTVNYIFSKTDGSFTVKFQFNQP